MVQAEMIFDAPEGRRRKEEGMELAAGRCAFLLDMARLELERIALLRPDRCVTADDAARWLHSSGYGESLGPAAGSLFRGGRWEFTGRWVESSRVKRHSGMIRVWKLK